jgi:hypothetical protein
MSLPSRPVAPIPQGTARAARAAFLEGTPYMTLRDAFGTPYQDQPLSGSTLR